MPIKIGRTRLYPVLELARKFKVTPSTLKGYLKNGRIEGEKLGGTWYISENSIRKFLKSLPKKD